MRRKVTISNVAHAIGVAAPNVLRPTGTVQQEIGAVTPATRWAISPQFAKTMPEQLCNESLQQRLAQVHLLPPKSAQHVGCSPHALQTRGPTSCSC